MISAGSKSPRNKQRDRHSLPSQCTYGSGLANSPAPPFPINNLVGGAQQSQGYFGGVAKEGLAHEIALLIADRNNGTTGDATRVVHIAAVDPKMAFANAIRAALVDCNAWHRIV